MTTRRDIPDNYGDAARLLNLPKPKKRLTIANNTVVERLTDAHADYLRTGVRTYDSFGLLLHGHLILTWHHDGRVVLDSCGWRTVTTADRLNRAQRVCRVYQRKHQWYIAKLVRRRFDPDTEEVFFDGITYTDTDQALGAYYDTHGGVGQPSAGD